MLFSLSGMALSPPLFNVYSHPLSLALHLFACIFVFPLDSELLESKEQISLTQHWLIEGKGVRMLLETLLGILLARPYFLLSPPQT